MAEILQGPIAARREADGRLVIEQAPKTAYLPLELLASADPVVFVVSGNTIHLAGQVTYRVTGWDPVQSALVLERRD